MFNDPLKLTDLLTLTDFNIDPSTAPSTQVLYARSDVNL